MDPQAWAQSGPAIEIPCQRDYVELVNRVRPSIFVTYTAEGLNAGLTVYCRERPGRRDAVPESNIREQR